MPLDGQHIPRVVHVITGLGGGGAETMLARLLGALRADIDSSVICLSVDGQVGDRIRALGVPVEILGLASGPLAFSGLPRLINTLKRRKPDLVHTWMYHADLLGGIAAKVCGIPVLWGLHNSTLDSKDLGRSTACLIKFLAVLSRRVPTRIVSCSEEGLKAHVAGGYDAHRMLVIQNGFDVDQFQPSQPLRAVARRDWGCSDGDLVVGTIARFSPLKDHETFLRAAGLAARREPRLRFVLYGDKVTPDNTTLLEWARRAGVLDRCSFLGREPAVERRLPGLDLLVSSSLSEAFPLILGEAMACGVLCVTTDAGDSAVIVGDPARVVPRNNPVALADAIVRAVQLDAGRQAADAASAVEHIRTQFALPQIAARFRALYTELAGAQLSLAANDATS